MGVMNWESIKNKIDNIWFGLGIGAILPVIGFVLSKFVKDKSGSYTWKAYFNLMTGQTNYYLEILTFSLLPSMLFFYLLFFQWKLDQAARGLIFMTIVAIALVFMLH